MNLSYFGSAKKESVVEILLSIGLVFTYIVIFVALPYLIFKSLKEFILISEYQNPILKYTVIIAVLLAYVLIMSVFFLFNLKILD